jgi:subfamily B ATP-binding cassette protein MsbA
LSAVEPHVNKFIHILSYVRPYKKLVGLNIAANLFYVLFDILSLLLFIPFLDLLFSEGKEVVTAGMDFELSKEYLSYYFNNQMASRIQESGKLGALSFVCGITILLFFLKNIFRYLGYLCMAKVRQGISFDIRAAIYDKVITLPLSFFSDERKGDIIARNTIDVNEVDQSIVGSLELLFKDPLNIILSFTAMIMISPSLTMFSLILMPISALIIGRISKSLKRTSRKGQDKQGEVLSFLEESITGLRIIKAFNAEGAIRHSFFKMNDSLRRISIRLLNKRDAASPLSEFLGACVMVGVIWYGGRLILSGDASALSGSEFIGFIIIFSQSLRPIQSISKAIASINKGMASVDRIDAIVSAKSNITDPEVPTEIKAFEKEVSYENVNFNYGGETVLHDISFKIGRGQTVALVGESGGGKSTVADLLPRFYDPVNGKVSIDGVPLRDMRLTDLRDMLGVVSQQAILFNDTIWENITLGHPAKEEEVHQAAKIAHAHDFIMALPLGYQTNIGDAGGKLSGGQRQRISIARAVLKNPPILILDEATSALDTESERLVQDALEHLMENRTSLVIAHRLSTIQHADKILVIQGGRIVEQGTHKELLSLDGQYKKLCDMQGFT